MKTKNKNTLTEKKEDDLQKNIEEILNENPIVERKKKIKKINQEKNPQLKNKKEEENENKELEHEVFIGGLNFEASEQNIFDFFSKCGEIKEVKLLYKEDGKSKGRGFIKFNNNEGCLNAIKLNGIDMMNRKIIVELPKNKIFIKEKTSPKFFVQINSETNLPESMNVIVRNIPFEVRENDLEEFFKQCGKIKNTRIIRNGDGSSKGFGFVDFCDIDSAKNAIQKTGCEIEGREIAVSFSIPKEQQNEKHMNKFKNKIRGVKSKRKKAHLLIKERKKEKVKKNPKFGGNQVNKGFPKQTKSNYHNPEFKGEIHDL
jgi:RNA recognition motif-containing protein